MRLPSSFVAPSAAAILSTALLCGLTGTAVSQTATGSTTALPDVTVEAPKQAARPHRPNQEANTANTVAPRRTGRATVASRLTSPNLQTPWDGKGSAMPRLAALERTSSNCTDGCQTSFKYGNQPWNGCSVSGGIIPPPSPTCRNARNYKTYEECRQTGLFLGANERGVWWYCSSLLAGGKLSGEKRHVAELERSGRR